MWQTGVCMMDDHGNAELVDMARSGRSEAFDVLVQRYQKKVTQLVYRYVNDFDTALDVVQDIFFRIFRNLHRFKGDCAFSTWLYRISVNVCIDHSRRRKVRKETSLEAMAYDAADERRDRDVVGGVIRHMERAQVRKALARLSSDEKMVIVMKVYEELTFDEIAEILGEPVSTIKSRLYKALDRLGKRFRRNELMRMVKQ